MLQAQDTQYWNSRTQNAGWVWHLCILMLAKKQVRSSRGQTERQGSRREMEGEENACPPRMYLRLRGESFAPLTWESRICFWFSPCLMNSPHLSMFLASNSLWEEAIKKFTARFSILLSWEDTASTHTPADGLGWNRKLAETLTV